MYKLKTILDIPEESVVPVDCGNCPVNMACITNTGRTGLAFNCCNVTTVFSGDEVCVIDCGKHSWTNVRETAMCNLCSGQLVDLLLANTDAGSNLYVPTVHARVPLKQRFALWREKLPEARAKREFAEERKRKLKA